MVSDRRLCATWLLVSTLLISVTSCQDRHNSSEASTENGEWNDMQVLGGKTSQEVISLLGKPEREWFASHEQPIGLDEERFWDLTQGRVLVYESSDVVINTKGVVTAVTPRRPSDRNSLRGKRLGVLLANLGSPESIGILASRPSKDELAKWLNRPRTYKVLNYGYEVITIDANGRVSDDEYVGPLALAQPTYRYDQRAAEVLQDMGLPESVECVGDLKSHSAQEVKDWLAQPLEKRLYYFRMVVYVSREDVVTETRLKKFKGADP
jgi:hypothetical protein